MHESRLMHSVRRILVVVGVVLGVAVLSAGVANADGPVQLKSRLGDVCLEAPSAGWFTALVINPCNGSDFQRWNLNPDQEIESAARPGDCVNIGNMLYAFVQPCVNGISQHWTVQPDGLVSNLGSNCLTVLGGPDPGTWVSTRLCAPGAPDQEWDTVP
ncbi:hypothetical protein MSIMFI_04678 [Mycobacterium simulans]|uniref:Rv1419 family lectin n=1 Tax=Mycobacterium simulans TaxID=627089 RepID=UPI001748078A|nr:RICIN domain-containing protein [Mycobacterium simulans]SON63148.1 hypothetical protein MSIMFI_04678 [Mycobacterium simulans]